MMSAMKNKYFQQGVGLIEVLVTLLILSTSLITLTAMQNRSLQFNQMAYFRSQANILAYDILDRMRTNKGNAGSLTAYNIALAPFPGGAAPAATDYVATDLFEWRREIDARIPGGEGGIECDADSVCKITIEWDEINSSTDSDDDEATSSFIYSARL
jgi:type IV pilus assembly protein PilV